MCLYDLLLNSVSHTCVGLVGSNQRGGLKDGDGRGGANIMQDGIVDLQHGTGVDEDSNPCIRGHYSKLGFFAFGDPHI
jgi:hypothetical protein